VIGDTTLGGVQTPQAIWSRVLCELEGQVNKSNFRTWLDKSVGREYGHGRFVIDVPNEFVADYLRKNQLGLIEKVLYNILGDDVRVEFSIKGETYNIGQDGTDLQATGSFIVGLDPNLKFTRFVGNTKENPAFRIALIVANNPGLYNPAVIYGRSASGKTHLMHSIAWAALDAKRIKSVICVKGADFSREYVANCGKFKHPNSSLQDSREVNADRARLDFFEKYTSTEMLLIDDIFSITPESEKSLQALFYIFDELRGANRQIVITNDRPPKEMHSLEERLRTRFEWGVSAKAVMPGYETRCQILSLKISERNLSIPADVVSLIASKAGENVRELEGALNRVEILSAAGIPLTIDTVREELGDAITPENSTTPTEIVEAVARVLGVSAEGILAGRQFGNTGVMVGRELAMYVIREELGYSAVEIGHVFGGLQPKYVNIGCREVEKGLKTKSKTQQFLSKTLPEIRKLIYPEDDGE